MLESQIKYNATQYIIKHQSEFKKELQEEAIDFIMRKIEVTGTTVKSFKDLYRKNLMDLIRKEISNSLSLNFEEVNEVVSDQFLLDLLGENFFIL